MINHNQTLMKITAFQNKKTFIVWLLLYRTVCTECCRLAVNFPRTYLQQASPDFKSNLLQPVITQLPPKLRLLHANTGVSKTRTILLFTKSWRTLLVNLRYKLFLKFSILFLYYILYSTFYKDICIYDGKI